MKNICYIIIAFSISLFSCKRDAESLKSLGPILFGIDEPFSISSDQVDFVGGKVNFNAKLTKAFQWSIEIKGLSSGAAKYITGNSQYIDVSNAVWDGSSDVPIFFGAETCEAVISFPNTKQTQTITFKINVPKAHPGYLINDFESSSFGNYLGSNNGNYFDGPDQATSTIDLYTFSFSPQGNKVLRFNCNDVNNSYYTGGVYHTASGSSHGIPSMNNDSLYLNLFIYGYTGGNAAITVEVKESDGDVWTLPQVAVNWTGWKLVSFKYSQAADNKSKGNVTKETNRINDVGINMNSVPSGQNCRALVDYLIFTVGKPLQP